MMKLLISSVLAFFGVIFFQIQIAQADGFDSLRQCYSKGPKVVESQVGDKKEYEYHNEADVQSACSDQARKMAEKNSGDGKYIADLAQVVGEGQTWEQALTVFNIGLKATPALCSNEKLQYAVKQSLRHPADDHNYEKYVTMAKSIAFEKCWPAHKEAVLEALAGDSGGGYVYQNCCATLMKKNALTGLKAARCEKLKN